MKGSNRDDHGEPIRKFYQSCGNGADVLNGGVSSEATGDTYIDVEFVNGSRFDDDITGDDLNNRLNRQAGDDILNGAGGNEPIIGDLGLSHSDLIMTDTADSA